MQYTQEGLDEMRTLKYMSYAQYVPSSINQLYFSGVCVCIYIYLSMYMRYYSCFCISFFAPYLFLLSLLVKHLISTRKREKELSCVIHL